MNYLNHTTDELIKAAKAEPVGSLGRELVDALEERMDTLEGERDEALMDARAEGDRASGLYEALMDAIVPQVSSTRTSRSRPVWDEQC